MDRKILGTMIAPESPSSWDERDASQWMAFTNIDGLNIDGYGYGVVDGRGKTWWDQSCRYHPLLVHAVINSSQLFHLRLSSV